MTAPVRLLLAALLTFVPVVARADDPLAKKLEAVMDGKDYKQARWGVLVTDAKTGDVLYAREPDKLFTPASTTKLLSGAAALESLGPMTTFRTTVRRVPGTNQVIQGTFEGKRSLMLSAASRKPRNNAPVSPMKIVAGFRL